MTSQAKHAGGTVLEREGVAVAEITNVGGVKLKADTIDVTSHDSPSGMKEFIPGLKDAGDVSIEGNFIPGDTNGQMALLGDYDDGTISEYTITSPDGDWEWAFEAMVTGFETMDAKVGDKQGFRATLKISGMAVLSVGETAAPSGLAVSVGTLNPAYAGAVLDYVDPVVTGTSSLTFTVTAAGAESIVLHNGYTDADATLTSGVASAAQSIDAAGTITLFTVKVKDAGKVPKVYAIRVSRAAS